MRQQIRKVPKIDQEIGFEGFCPELDWGKPRKLDLFTIDW